MRTRMKDMLRKPGFPNDVYFFEVNCFDVKQMNELRTKVKSLINE